MLKIVIELSEDSYKATCNGSMLPPDVENVVNAIKNGTILPKGHGRLIDADELLDANIDTFSQQTEFKIKFAPTIIEAEKENADEE